MKTSEKVVLAQKTPFLGADGVFFAQVLVPFRWGLQASERSVMVLDVARCAFPEGRKQDNPRHPVAQLSVGYPQTDAPLRCNGASVVS